MARVVPDSIKRRYPIHLPPKLLSGNGITNNNSKKNDFGRGLKAETSV
jgi:hypothetical protein